MKSVENIHQLNKLIDQVKKKIEVVNSNFYLMPSAIDTYLVQDRLFWIMDKNGLFLICEENDFYYLYYFFSTKITPKSFDWLGNFNKPIIINNVYLESNKSKKIIDAEEFWLDAGFNYYRINRRMTAQPRSEKKAEIDKVKVENDYYVGYAKKTDAVEILSLWRKNLDIYASPLPDYNGIIKLIDKSQMLGGYKKNNKLVAALQIGLMKNVSYIDYVAVNPEYRRLGLAQWLLDFYFSLPDQVSRYFLWVNKKNHPAIKLYRENGYIFDGRMSSQLILEGSLTEL